MDTGLSLHDVRRNRGRRFMATSSNCARWMFGEFDKTYIGAHVAESHEAESLERDGNFLAYPLLGFNVVEHITFWAQALPGKASEAEARSYTAEWDWLEHTVKFLKYLFSFRHQFLEMIVGKND